MAVAVLGSEAEELLEVLAGDDTAPADLHIQQVPATHLVVEQIAGESSQARGLVNGVGQPFSSRICSRFTAVGGSRALGRGSARIGWTRLARAHGLVASHPGVLAAGSWPLVIWRDVDTGAIAGGR